MENVITLGKLLSQWFCFLLSILVLKTKTTKKYKEYDRSPCNGNHFSSSIVVLYRLYTGCKGGHISH